jgi:hypothetical protein
MRKMIFSFIVFYLHEDKYALLQIASNMLLSLVFVWYLLHMRPFYNPWENMMQALNETTFLMVSICYFCFTDFNPDPLIKVYCGWFLIIIVIANLIWPNFTYMIKGIGPDIINSCKKTKVISLRKKRGLRNLE